MNDNYWKKYWDDHAKIAGSNPFKQVLRVQNKKPLNQELFEEIYEHIAYLLKLKKNHTVLDLCSGNGLITLKLSESCHHVTAVDFCDDFIKIIQNSAKNNVTAIVDDTNKIEFNDCKFDRILIAAALQHFSQTQVISLFKNIKNWLKPTGRLVITDILDANKIWNFYNTPERENAYFQNLISNTPILGTWYDKEWLSKLAKFSGFKHCEIIKQKKHFIYAHYRYDLVCFN